MSGGMVSSTRDSSRVFSWDITGKLPFAPRHFSVAYPSLDDVFSWRDHVDSVGSNFDLLSSVRERDATVLRSSYDTGHPFTLNKFKIDTSYGKHLNLPIYGPPYYDGRIIGDLRMVSTPNPASLTTIPALNLDYGARALDATRPTKPASSLTQFIAELSIDLPHLIGMTLFDGKKSKRSLHDMSDEYLNIQFGIAPSANDIHKIAKAVLHSAKIVEQFRRDSGRVVRRKRSFDPIITREPVVKTVINQGEIFDFGVSNIGQYALDECYGNYYSQAKPRTLTSEVITTQRYWFAGAWTYFLEDLSSNKFGHYEQLANKLLGIRITPDVLWELAPWSWLVDWFADVQSLIRNASAFMNDRLVLKYGYLMRTTKVMQINTVLNPNFRYWKPAYVSTTISHTRKERVRATPYGFGLNPNSFSTSQWAILGALGFTSSPRALRL